MLFKIFDSHGRLTSSVRKKTIKTVHALACVNQKSIINRFFGGMGGPVEAQLLPFVPAKQNNHNPEILSKYWPIYRYCINADQLPAEGLQLKGNIHAASVEVYLS